MGSQNFKRYVANINRIHLVEMVENFSLETRARNFRASLIANPITGIPYPDPELSCGAAAEFAAG